MTNREGQVWKVTNMMGGWTVFVITQSDEQHEMHIGVVLDGAGPLSADDSGKPMVVMEPFDSPSWELEPKDYTRLG